QVKIWFQNRRTKWKKQDGITNAEANEHKNAATGKNKKNTPPTTPCNTVTTPALQDHAKSTGLDGVSNPPISDAGSAPTSPSQMSNGATSDLSSSDETSHGDTALGISPHPDVHQDPIPQNPLLQDPLLQDPLPQHTPAKLESITTATTTTTTTTTTTFKDHIVIKEVVPAPVGLSYKNLPMAPKSGVVTPIKPIATHSPLKSMCINTPIPTHSPLKSMCTTPMSKPPPVRATSSPPQAIVPRGSPPAIPQGILNVTQKIERTLPQEASLGETVQDSAKILTDSEEKSS
ncbi:hypothetical protein OTU49_012174, partial [Cherax quadricarinatus]